MSEAMDLLNNLSDEEIAAYILDSANEPHIVIGEDRTVFVPDELKRIAVQYDHNVETVTFDCPRYWDGHDMSKMIVYINYMCADGYRDSYRADNVRVDDTDENIMHFEWTISQNVTNVKGQITFLVCTKETDDNGHLDIHWNSELNTDLYVSEGLECVEHVKQNVPDLLTQILLLNQTTLERAAVYVGSGDMPEWANVQIDPDGTDVDIGGGSTDGVSFELGETLELTEDGYLNVKTTNVAEDGNNLPITSSAVYALLGNVDDLLETI